MCFVHCLINHNARLSSDTIVPMAKAVIELKNVTKSYGSARGIKDVTLQVDKGEVFGFLGPNGAGKTTSISLMVDLMRPSTGSISVFGLDSVKDSLEIHRRIGFLMDDMSLEKGLTGWQQLEYFGNLRGNFNKTRVKELAKRLNCKLNMKFKNLSRGNRQKVALISALMHDPELLILDEPTSGLDPLIQAEFNKIILERKNKGKTAFISSHILSEVQELCDRVAFIREGKIISIKNVSDIGKDAPRQVKLSSNEKALEQSIKKLAGVHEFKKSKDSISFTYTGDINSLLAVLSRHRLDHLNVSDTDLETMFMKFYKDKNVK